MKISLKLVPKSPIDNKPSRWQAITWTNDDPVHWHIYGAQGRDELRWNFDGFRAVQNTKIFQISNKNLV